MTTSTSPTTTSSEPKPTSTMSDVTKTTTEIYTGKIDSIITDNSRSRSASPERESTVSAKEYQPPTARRNKGRGRGRGRGQNVPVNRAQRATEAREQKNAQIRERITSMGEEDLRTIMLTACERQPSFVLNHRNILAKEMFQCTTPVVANQTGAYAHTAEK